MEQKDIKEILDKILNAKCTTDAMNILELALDKVKNELAE